RLPARGPALGALERRPRRLRVGWRRELGGARVRLEGGERRVRLADRGVGLAQQIQRLDELGHRLEAATRAVLSGRDTRVRECRARLDRHSLRALLREYRERRAGLELRLARAARVLAARCEGR